MAERMTCDEHLQNAEDFVREANVLAERMLKSQSRELAPMVSALVEVGRLHLDLAGLEHIAAERCAPLWVQQSPGFYRRAPHWSLINFEKPTPGHDEVGWYMYGPGLSDHGYWTCPDLDGAQAMANRVIDAYLANQGSAEADA